MSLAPSGASSAPVPWHEVVATALDPPGPADGGSQVSSLACVLSVKPALASSSGGVAMLASSRRPSRSSTTAAPAGSGCLLSTWSRYVTKAPGATVPPDAGLAVTLTDTSGCALAEEPPGTKDSSEAPTARSARRVSIVRPCAGLLVLPWKEDLAGFAISTLPRRGQPANMPAMQPWLENDKNGSERLTGQSLC